MSPRRVRVVLVYPPTADPTAPYLALPSLAASLRQRGIEVVLLDANLEGWEWVLTPERLSAFRDRVVERLRRLERKASLDLEGLLAYRDLWRAYGLGDPSRGVPRALATLRGQDGRFFDFAAYDSAVTTLERAISVVGAAYTPLALGFATYHTPFGLLTIEEARKEACAERNPFWGYLTGVLVPRLEELDPGLIGVSIAFPGQVLPGYALSFLLKARFPHVPLVAGGPALTQLVAALEGTRREKALGGFDGVVLFEGERALVEAVRTLEHGGRLARIIEGDRGIDMVSLPAPDFEGLPMGRYLSPEPVIPYDVSRGCAWGRCAFCHYGLSTRGTARYRERPVERIADDLSLLRDRWGCRVFHFSHDGLSPGLGAELAAALGDLGILWSSDMRPDGSLDAGLCDKLARAGGLSLALGVESGADRVLRRMGKGLRVEEAREAVRHVADAGMAAEVMCFTGFPGETFEESLATVGFVRDLHDKVALFIIGTFGLTAGSRVAQHPDAFGVRTWRVCGDELGLGLFYEEVRPSMGQAQIRALDEAINGLSRGWTLRHYPWAGAISTAHTLLWFAHHGPGVFRRRRPPRGTSAARRWRLTPRIAPASLEAAVVKDEAIWGEMVFTFRAVSPDLYRSLAQRNPPTRPRTRTGGP